MKRWIHASSTYKENTDFLEISVNVTYDFVPVEGTSILNVDDSEFDDFEMNLLTALYAHDFELEDAYDSNRPDSISKYYILTKMNKEGTRLRVFVKLRISDHAVDVRYVDGKPITHKKRDIEHIKKEAQKLANEKYGQTRGYALRRLDIIFDDTHYQSYEKALQAIEKQLDEFDPE